MSSIIAFNVYDASNFDNFRYKEIELFKNLLIQKLDNNYVILDKYGHEYQKDNLNTIKFNEKNMDYIIHNPNDFSNDSIYENLEIKQLRDKILNQIKIDEILNEYLKSKRKIIETSFKVCKEIGEKCNVIMEDEVEDLKNFESNFLEFEKNSLDFQKYIKMIKQSLKEVNELSPKYTENIEEIEQMYNQTISEIDKIIDNTREGKPHYNTEDINELINIFKSYKSFINQKLSKIISNQQLTYNLESKINELLIYGEKINFYINLNDIPKIYEACKEYLEEELKRRSYFKYIYEQLLDFIENNLISKEFEQRKKFFETYCKIGEKSKMEKKTIDILNKIFNIQQEKIYEELKEKIDENDLNNLGSKIIDDESKKKIVFNEDLLKDIESLKNNLNGVLESLYSKNKKNNNNKNINDKSELDKPLNMTNEQIKNEFNDKFKLEIEDIKNNLKSCLVPEIKQKKILDIIENKIYRSLSNLSENKNKGDLINNNPSNEIESSYLDSDMLLSEVGDFNKNDWKNKNINANQIAKYFTKTYSKYLWFYNKVYECIKIYINMENKNYVQLIKEDPCSVNNCLVEILNENKTLKEKIQKIKNAMKKKAY